MISPALKLRWQTIGKDTQHQLLSSIPIPRDPQEHTDSPSSNVTSRGAGWGWAAQVLASFIIVSQHFRDGMSMTMEVIKEKSSLSLLSLSSLFSVFLLPLPLSTLSFLYLLSLLSLLSVFSLFSLPSFSSPSSLSFPFFLLSLLSLSFLFSLPPLLSL